MYKLILAILVLSSLSVSARGRGRGYTPELQDPYCDGPNRHYQDIYDRLWHGSARHCMCGPTALNMRATYGHGSCEKISSSPLCYRITDYSNHDINPNNMDVDVWEQCMGEAQPRQLRGGYY